MESDFGVDPMLSVNLGRKNLSCDFPGNQSLDDIGRLHHDGRVPVASHDQQLGLKN